ncbi:MAG: hypothetical protein AAF682_17500, partial [Planctomycetota bacterium]
MRVLLLVLFVLLGARPIRGDDEWVLFRNLARHASFELWVGGADLMPAAERAARRTELLGPRRVRVVAPDESDGSSPRVVVGLISEPWVTELAGGLELVQRGREGELELVALGRRFHREEDVLVATLADPERPGLPLTLYLGRSAPVLASHLDDVGPGWRKGVSAWRGGAPALRLPVRDSGAAAWREAEDFLQRRLEQEPPSYVRFAGVGLQVSPGVPEERAERYGRLLADVRSRAFAELGGGGELERLEVRVFGHAEELLYLHGRGERSRAFAARPGHAVSLLAGNVPHDGGACAARALALQLLGPPAVDWMLDGVGACYADTWWGWPMADWIGHLQQAGLAPELSVLVAPDAAMRLSPHVLVPLRGALFGYLLRTFGSELVARVWRGEEELAFGEELERGYRELLAANHEAVGERVGAQRERRRAALSPSDWRAGVHLVTRADADAALAARALEGMGIGWLARDELLGRQVALTTIR